MIISDSLLVAARGSAVPVSYRGIGSANGNRTCIAPVHFSPVRSKSLSLRSVCTPRTAPMPPRTVDVAARWQRGGSALTRFLIYSRYPMPLQRAFATRIQDALPQVHKARRVFVGLSAF